LIVVADTTQQQPMKSSRRTLLSVGFAAVVGLGSVVACKTRAVATEPPPRPSGVPQNAVWAGGAEGGSFLVLFPTTATKLYRGTIYDDRTGAVVFKGILGLDGGSAQPIDVKDPKAFRSWDGHTLHLEDGRLLTPRGK
jgi:hypothetical protein